MLDKGNNLVLIETYWNVNSKIFRFINTPPRVLIETYWNVNCIVAYFCYKVYTSINRNILECKYCFSRYSLQQNLVLIETYWNVNISTVIDVTFKGSVLIETYWNVNKKFLSKLKNRENSINRNILECK